jgi:spermidine synthase
MNPIHLLTVVFILSGAAGLMYESIWSRYLGLFVGHSAYAQIIVLVIFLGGMAVGAMAIGTRSARIQRPLFAYAVVELVVGIIGLLFHASFQGVTAIAYQSLFPALSSAGGATAVLVGQWMLAGLLILPQSILLGTTFPLMTAGAMRIAGGRPGHTLSILYFANSLGAAIGVLVAGFYLVKTVGLPGTLAVAAVLNILVAAMVVVAERGFEWEEAQRRGMAGSDPQPAGAAARTAAAGEIEPPGGPAAGPAGDTQRDALRGLGRVLLFVAFGTAVASFIYEIAWIRMLSLVLGSATHSFELMLSAFILGLALGAFAVRKYADRVVNTVMVLGMVQWMMGVLAMATLPLYLRSFGWMETLLGALERSDGGYVAFYVARYAICLAIMLPATFFAGMTLPLITRALLARGAGERAIGAVYGINTLGSIIGVMLAGLVLMPLLGLKNLLILGATLDILLGVWLLWPAFRDGSFGVAQNRAILAVISTVVFIGMMLVAVRLEPLLLTSAVYRYGDLRRAGGQTMIFYRDGRTATVSVKEGAGGGRTLATNGKPDASLDAEWLREPTLGAGLLRLQSDLPTQILLPLITLAHAPEARSAAVIGQGSGISSHFLLASENLQHLTTVEIEPEMIRGSRHFYPMNRRVFDDPRSLFVVDDAKSYFAAGQRRYDLILSEPSNPWVSGVASLFTVEFYARVKTHLNPGGVFGQWLHMYEIDDSLVMTILAALDHEFDDYEIFVTAGGDLLVVAAASGKLPPADWRVFDLPGVASDLARAVPVTPEVLEATRMGGAPLYRPMLLTYADPNSDFHPTLELGAERTRFLGHAATGFSSMGSRRFDIAAAIFERRRGFGSDSMSAIPAISRVDGLARGAWLRILHETNTPADPIADYEIAKSAFRRETFDQVLTGSRPPTSWRAWYTQFSEVESDLHHGTAGVIDEDFYRRSLDYATRNGAPEALLAAVRFQLGIANWDWNEVIGSITILEAESRARRPWVNPEVLRDGAMVAFIKTGRPSEARSRFDALTELGDESSSPFRFKTRLWKAYLANEMRGERGGG